MITTNRVLAVSGLIVIAVLLYFFNPAASSLYPPCIFRKVTGYYCPGCGSLRALHNLLHGHIAAAARMNILLIAALPVLAANAVIDFLHNRRIISMQPPFNSTLMVIIIFCITIIYTITRNIPHHPFSLLAPH